MQPTHARWEPAGQIVDDNDNDDNNNDIPSLFPPVRPDYAQTYRIVDISYESPAGPWGLPGIDGDTLDMGFNGLSSISDDILAELPADCRQAFDAARHKERTWKNRWVSESRDGMRMVPPIDKGQF